MSPASHLKKAAGYFAVAASAAVMVSLLGVRYGGSATAQDTDSLIFAAT